MIRHLAVATVALAGVIGAVGAGAATAQSDTVTLTTSTQSAPSVAAGLEFVLLRDGVDVTDEFCEPATDAAIPTRTCSGLTQADWRIEILGVPADAIVVGTCNGIAQQLPPFDLVPFLLGFTYDCTGTVSEPGVVMRRDTPARPELATLATLTDADGNEVDTDCELDTRLGDDAPREWCTGLADGVYTVVPADVPDGYRSGIACAPMIDLAPAGTPFPDDPTTAPVTAERPLWECASGEAVAPLSFQMQWSDGPIDDIAWIDGLMPNVVDADGVNVSATCAETSRSINDIIEVFFQCPGVANGIYDVSLDGVPNEFAMDSTCDGVEVTETTTGTCTVFVFDNAVNPGGGEDGGDDDAQEDEPTDDTPAATQVPTPLLPATGTASSNVALAGLGLGALGVGLVLSVRRRPQRPTI